MRGDSGGSGRDWAVGGAVAAPAWDRLGGADGGTRADVRVRGGRRARRASALYSAWRVKLQSWTSRSHPSREFQPMRTWSTITFPEVIYFLGPHLHA
jgi:hypothetical protein